MVNQILDEILAVGEEARQMLGGEHRSKVKPLRDGVISDYDITEKMLKYFIKRFVVVVFFKPRIMVCKT